VKKLVSVAKFEVSDIKASIAAIAFIITNAVKFNVDTATLANELQQLGLPKGGVFFFSFLFFFLFLLLWRIDKILEHTRAISKTYGNKADKLQAAIKEQSLRGAIPIHEEDEEIQTFRMSSVLFRPDSEIPGLEDWLRY